MRRRRAEKREIAPDPVYNSEVVAKFINIIMLDGKKSVAMNVVYDALEELKEKHNEDAVKVFNKALDNIRPRLIVKSRRIGGATYQVPTEITKEKGFLIAMRWIRDTARAKKGKGIARCLVDELGNAYKNEGSLVKKRDDTHKMAEANRAFAHFK